MMQGTGCVYAGLAGHAFQILDSCSLVNEEMSLYPYSFLLTWRTFLGEVRPYVVR